MMSSQASVPRIDELARVLRGINHGTVPEEEAKRVLSNVDPVELSLAEQRLIQDGVAPEELRGLCVAHMKVLEGDAEDLKAAAGEGHPLHTLVSEHELILEFLDSLEAAVRRLEKRGEPVPGEEDVTLVAGLAEHLVETEKHHAREEEALFPALEERGVSGPTRIMRLEHNKMRPKKKHLLEIAKRAAEGSIPYDEFVKDLRATASFVVFNLRDHIVKENTILYPAAFEAIREPRAWDDIRRKCDEIGYCCFTPGYVSVRGAYAHDAGRSAHTEDSCRP